eukprot:scaffold300745_cov22-Prasinocladus_malaysianus.AAC.1
MKVSTSTIYMHWRQCRDMTRELRLSELARMTTKIVNIAFTMGQIMVFGEADKAMPLTDQIRSCLAIVRFSSSTLKWLATRSHYSSLQGVCVWAQTMHIIYGYHHALGLPVLDVGLLRD